MSGVRRKEGIDFDLSILNSGSWILTPNSLVSIVTPIVSKSAPGKKWRVYGQNELTTYIF